MVVSNEVVRGVKIQFGGGIFFILVEMMRRVEGDGLWIMLLKSG